jgi:predicted nucleic acid-binding protein
VAIRFDGRSGVQRIAARRCHVRARGDVRARRAAPFAAFIEQLRPLRLVSVDADQHAGGVAVLRRFSNQDLTLADAVGLHVMKSLGIESCWSTDFHLGLTGARLVIDEH